MDRRLTTILAADIAGFSRLVGADEESTLSALLGHRTDLIDPLLERHGGRIANTAGDSLLIEFQSAVEAARCAIAIQDGMRARNEGLAPDRRIEFRIGLNVGDVINRDGDLLGDGVNVAARLEALAPPGGIILSRSVRDQIRDRLEADIADLGEITVRHIARPVRAFQVLREGENPVKVAGAPRRQTIQRGVAVAVLLAISAVAGLWYSFRPDFAPADPTRMAYALPNRPSIAVLAFDNLSGDPDQEFLSDGLTEDITSALARIPQLFVIARNSAFTYKGQPVKVQQVAEDLGVRYVLEGSVQRDGERLRVTAQLVDAIGGQHVWTQRYEHDMQDLFAIKDDIAKQISIAVNVELVHGNTVWGRNEDTTSLEAWLLHLRAWDAHNKWSLEGNAEALRFSKLAVAAEPTSAQLYAGLGWRYFMQAQFRWTDAPEQAIESAEAAARKARELNDESPSAYALQTAISLYKREFDQAISAGQKATELAPNDADMLAMLALAYQKSLQPTEAITYFSRSVRLNPHTPAWILENLGESYLIAGRYEEAIEAYKRTLSTDAGSAVEGEAYLGLAVAHDSLGREDEARVLLAKGIKAFPQFTAEYLRAWSLYSDSDYTERWISALVRLGLPEE